MCWEGWEKIAILLEGLLSLKRAREERTELTLEQAELSSFHVRAGEATWGTCHGGRCSASKQKEKKGRDETSILTKTELFGHTVGKSFLPQRTWEAGAPRHLSLELWVEMDPAGFKSSAVQVRRPWKEGHFALEAPVCLTRVRGLDAPLGWTVTFLRKQFELPF